MSHRGPPALGGGMQVDGVGGVGRPSAASPCVWDKGCGVGVMEGVGGARARWENHPNGGWGVFRMGAT